MDILSVIIIYLAFVNLLGVYAMYSDKQRAKKRVFRIPEATLFAIALVGGSIGCIAGMYLFRHKTKHWYFIYGMPLILILQIAGIFLLKLAPIEIRFM